MASRHYSLWLPCTFRPGTSVLCTLMMSIGEGRKVGWLAGCGYVVPQSQYLSWCSTRQAVAPTRRDRHASKVHLFRLLRRQLRELFRKAKIRDIKGNHTPIVGGRRWAMAIYPPGQCFCLSHSPAQVLSTACTSNGCVGSAVKLGNNETVGGFVSMQRRPAARNQQSDSRRPKTKSA